MRPATLSAGDLTDRVTIERDATPKSASGGIKPWTVPEEVARVWARIRPIGAGREIFGNPDWTTGLSAYHIDIRRRVDIDEKMRVKYVENGAGTTRYFSIHSVPLGGPQDFFISLVCEEIK